VYEVYLERSAENDLKRLTTSIFHRIIPHIKTLAGNPRPSGCIKITGSRNDWRIRIGDYRIIYEIDEEAKAVRIMRVRHRREVYRR
jgi:mRNA interferase RelE/StbE